ncbi:MAG TPA: hypothetical protein VM736_12550 [Gemmatimonadales bacterium]|nr:hypothetical protein [Gemmatimonadales bacterium]
MGELVCIRTFPSRLEAELAKGLLEARGISAMVSMDDAGGMRPEMAFIKGASLFVEPQVAERALELLPAQPRPVISAERRALDTQLRGCLLPALLGSALLVAGLLVVEVATGFGTALFVAAGGLLLTALVRALRATKRPPRPTVLR